MRVYREFESLRLRADESHVAELARAENVTTVRYEAVFRERLGSATIDILFERGTEALVLHTVLVDMIALATLEGPALIWPVRYAIADDVANAIDKRVTPWLRTLVRGRAAAGEYVRSYVPSELFAFARANGFRGAAPYAQTLATSAPFVYARRFLDDGAAVRITCRDGYHAAAVLDDALHVQIVEPGGSDKTLAAFARRWYGDPVKTGAQDPTLVICDRLEEADDSARVVVATQASAGAYTVIVPQAVPLDQLFTYDAAEAPEAARFSVRATDRVARPIRRATPATPVGGSGGRIAFVLRDDGAYAPDADTDAIEELARRLRTEGLDISLTVALNDPVLGQADLIHIFGAVNDAHTYAAIQLAQQLARPYVISLEPVAVPYSRYREEALLAALRLGADDSERTMYLNAFFAGKLIIDELPAAQSEEELQAADRRFGAACAGASFVLLAPTESADAFRRRFPEIAPERMAVAGTFVPDESAETPVAEIVPAKPFVFLHGSIVQRTNQTAFLHALSGSGIPVVVAGAVSDVDLCISLRRVGSEAIVIPDPTPGMISALYRRAAVYVDASHRPAGPSRIVRAAASGMLPMLPYTSPLTSLTAKDLLFDINDPKAIAPAVRSVLERPDALQLAARIAGHNATLVDPVRSLQDVVSAYVFAST